MPLCRAPALGGGCVAVCGPFSGPVGTVPVRRCARVRGVEMQRRLHKRANMLHTRLGA